MRILLPLAFAASICAADICVAQSLKPDEVLSSIAVRPISEPNPVLGADDRLHLAYELLITNPSRLFMTLDKVEAVDGSGRSLWSLEGDQLAAMTTLFSGTKNVVPPGGSAAVFMDVSFGANEKPPAGLSARITTSRQAAGPDGKPMPLPAGTPVPAKTTFTGAEIKSGPPAVTIEPPLRGRGWIAVNGCCDSVTSHRGAIMAVNGQLRVPERFAIDWVQLDSTNRIFTGDPSRLSSYHYYGTPVHAAADGVVVNLYDEAEEQIPGTPAKGITPENIGGNMLVIDVGGGAYAFYAHLQKGSLKARLGDRVTTGQVIGLLGNTGNSTAPHLHFHVMDGPSPLDANGLPYVFTSFKVRGVVEASDDNDPIEKGEPAKINTDKLDGAHANQLPLNNQVVDFN
jgi:hypothetical protein